MEQIGKIFMGFIIILVIAFMGTGIISASVDGANAEQFATATASSIEASNFSQTVVNQLKEDAKNKGYVLDVTIFDTNNDGWNDMAEVNVKYYYSIKLFNAKGSIHVAKAYAR